MRSKVPNFQKPSEPHTTKSLKSFNKFIQKDWHNACLHMKVMHRRQIKKLRMLLFAPFLLLLLTSLKPGTSYAQSVPKAKRTKSRRIHIWNQKLDYQYRIEHNSHVPYDGKAFVEEKQGAFKAHVVLNTAYFAQEARSLFKKLQRSTPTKGPSFPKNLLGPLQKLSTTPSSLNSLPHKTLHQIKAWQENLALLSWNKVYQTCRISTDNRRKALLLFIEKFVQSRMRTIEYHEVSHLIDVKNHPNAPQQHFARRTELNAFYTELAYGENPLDVLAQALSGVLEEAHQGRLVDFSTEKVIQLNQYLEQHVSSKGLESFDQLSTTLRKAGQNLHQTQNQGLMPQFAAK